MSEPAAEKSTAERLLDLAFFAPLGLALSVAEAVPDLASKGRARLGPQVVLARTVGKLAVRQGYRQLAGVAGSVPFSPFGSSNSAAPARKPPVPTTAPGPTASAPNASGPAASWSATTAPAKAGSGRTTAGPSTSAARTRAAAPIATVAREAALPLARSRSNGARPHGARAAQSGGAQSHAAPDLAIHSYDSLSAPQVVQRLAGLSREEVAAVRAYEAATRGRRTILARAEQLLG